MRLFHWRMSDVFFQTCYRFIGSIPLWPHSGGAIENTVGTRPHSCQRGLRNLPKLCQPPTSGLSILKNDSFQLRLKAAPVCLSPAAVCVCVSAGRRHPRQPVETTPLISPERENMKKSIKCLFKMRKKNFNPNFYYFNLLQVPAELIISVVWPGRFRWRVCFLCERELQCSAPQVEPAVCARWWAAQRWTGRWVEFGAALLGMGPEPI